MKNNKYLIKVFGSITIALLMFASFPGKVRGDDSYEIHVETNQANYYPGEQVTITIELLKNGERYNGTVCLAIFDSDQNMIYGTCCFPKEPGYFIQNYTLDESALLGTYTISIDGDMDSWHGHVNKTFEVVSETISAEAYGPYEGKSGQPIQFSGDVTGGKPPYNWSWNFNDGSYSYDQNPLKTYHQGGLFTATLTVTDAGLHSDDDSATVIIQDVPYYLSVQTNQSFYFTNDTVLIFGNLTQEEKGASGIILINVTDPHQTLIFEDDVQTNSDGYYETSFMLASNAFLGEYTVFVKEETIGIINASLFDVYSSLITVDAHGPYEALVGQSIQFTGDATGGRSPYNWTWEFGDEQSSYDQNPQHIYQASGVYTASLHVSDNYNHTGSDTATVNISNLPSTNHTVFIEEGTGTWCQYCPAAAKVLQDLFESGKFPFYYVALIEDKNTEAHSRVVNDYNILGYPTVFVDGGYQVVYGAQAQSNFEQAILAAIARVAPKLNLTLTCDWNKSTNKMETTVVIRSLEDTPYAGHLRVYLTEINSRWNDYNGTSYHYGFLDYLLNENITVEAQGTLTRMSTMDVGALDPANLMVVAAVFNATAHPGYAKPPNGNPFNAYYTDVTAGKRVAEGNLPPEVGITNPKNGRLHILGKSIMATKNLNTILLGRTNITAQASDDSHVTKVEFYIDEKLMITFTEEPYEWIWKGPSWFPWRHTIKVIAYDDHGKSTTVSMDVSAFILL